MEEERSLELRNGDDGWLASVSVDGVGGAWLCGRPGASVEVGRERPATTGYDGTIEGLSYCMPETRQPMLAVES
jgi:hypothetical protein